MAMRETGCGDVGAAAEAHSTENKQEHKSNISERDRRGGIQMNVENSVGTCAYKDEHSGITKPKK